MRIRKIMSKNVFHKILLKKYVNSMIISKNCLNQILHMIELIMLIILTKKA